jgi:hypothetical protein
MLNLQTAFDLPGTAPIFLSAWSAGSRRHRSPCRQATLPVHARAGR